MANKLAPIFIVGVPRSGTTLLAAMLAAHSCLSSGPETHFYRWLRKVSPEELLEAETWPDKAVDFLFSIVRETYLQVEAKSLPEKYGLDRDQIYTFLSRSEPSIAAILSSITELHMRRMNKIRWVEKTPDHIENLTDIRKSFPDAYVIRIIRDPRDTALSLGKMPWWKRSFLEGLQYWKRLENNSREFFVNDRLAYTLRFEDLVLNPAGELCKICDFVGLSFEPNMLDTSQSAKMVNSTDAPWKTKASQPLDGKRINAWEKELSPADNLLAESYLGDCLDLYNYRRIENLPNYAMIFPSNKSLPEYPGEMLPIISQHVRFWSISNAEPPNIRIFIGDPADGDWKNKYRPAGVYPVVLMAELIAHRIRRGKIIWISDDKKTWTGLTAFFLKKVLALLETELDSIP